MLVVLHPVVAVVIFGDFDHEPAAKVTGREIDPAGHNLPAKRSHLIGRAVEAGQ